MATPSVLLIRQARVSRIVHVTPELFTLSCTLVVDDGFSYQAGQWVYLHLLNDRGESIARAAFSVASAPIEGKSELEFGIKVYGRFTQTCSELRVGDVLGVQGPFGVFTLPKEPAPFVFLAAGIGITPLRSLICEALHKKDGPSCALIWIDKTWENLLYHEDFLTWQAAFPERFLYHPSLTRDAHPEWTGSRGRLESQMLDMLPVDWSQAEAYVCGPLSFMETAKTLLTERGIVGRPRLHEERFA